MNGNPVQTIAVIGGTGKEGKGLVQRWSRAGYRVIVGSRSEEKAETAATEFGRLLNPGTQLIGMSNLDAAREADIVVLTVPYPAQRETLESIKSVLKRKLVICATVPLVAGSVSKAKMPAAGSAAQEAQQILGEGAEIAAAFHSISHERLWSDGSVDSDVLVTGTSKEARNQALILVESAGLKGWDAGPLENSAVTEGLASVLIHLNRTYKSSNAGIRITGIEKI